MVLYFHLTLFPTSTKYTTFALASVHAEGGVFFMSVHMLCASRNYMILQFMTYVDLPFTSSLVAAYKDTMCCIKDVRAKIF